MRYCPECGSRLEPGDTFCINCGVSLEEAQHDVNKESGSDKKKKKIWPIVVCILAVAVIALAAAAYTFINSPAYILARAASKTADEIKDRPMVQLASKLYDGSSLKASAGLNTFFDEMSFLDSFDAKAEAKAYYDKSASALVVNAGASISSLPAMDATLWLTPQEAVIKSGVFLGKDAYRIDLSKYYPSEETAAVVKEVLIKAGASDRALSDFALLLLKNGETKKEKVEDKTLIHLTLDRKAVETSFEKAFDMQLDVPADFILRLCFTIDEKGYLSAVNARNDYINTAVSLAPSVANADTIKFSLDCDIYNVKCNYKIAEETATSYKAALAYTLNDINTAAADIAWDIAGGDFNIKINGAQLTPEMKLIVTDNITPEKMPEKTKELSLRNGADVVSFSTAVDKNVSALLDELGLVFPISIADSVALTCDYISENYLELLGGGRITMSKRQFEEIVNTTAKEAAESAAAEVAESVAESVAAEIAESVAYEVGGQAALDMIKSTRTTIPGSLAVTSEAESVADRSNLYSEIAGNYIYKDGENYGIDASANFTADGKYSFSCKALFFNISDSGTYTIDSEGRMLFKTTTSYKADGRYSDGKIILNISGFGDIELVKQ